MPSKQKAKKPAGDDAVVELRKLLSKEDPPVQQIGELLQTVLDNADGDPNERTRIVTDLGVVPILAQLVKHSDDIVRGQAISCLTNIATDCTSLRDLVFFQPGLVEDLGPIMTDSSVTVKLYRATIELVGGFAGCPPIPDLVTPFIARIAARLRSYSSLDPDILEDLLWATGRLCSSINVVHLQGVADSGILLIVRDILSSPVCSRNIRTAAAEFFGELLPGYEKLAQVMLNIGITKALARVVIEEGNCEENLLLAICLALRNIAAGPPGLRQSLFDETNLIESLITLAANNAMAMAMDENADHSLVRALAEMFLVILDEGTPEQVQILQEKHVFQALSAMLRVEGARSDAWRGIRSILFKVPFLEMVNIVQKVDLRASFKFNQIPGLLATAVSFRELEDQAISSSVTFHTLLLAMGCDPRVPLANPAPKVLSRKKKKLKSGVLRDKDAFALAPPRTKKRLQEITVLTHLCAVSTIERLRTKHQIWLPLDIWKEFKRYIYTAPVRTETIRGVTHVYSADY